MSLSGIKLADHKRQGKESEVSVPGWSRKNIRDQELLPSRWEAGKLF